MALHQETLNNMEMVFLALSLKIGTAKIRRSYSNGTQPNLLPSSKQHSFSTGKKLKYSHKSSFRYTNPKSKWKPLPLAGLPVELAKHNGFRSEFPSQQSITQLLY